MTIFLILTLLIVVAIGWLKLRDEILDVDSHLRWSAKEDRTALERQVTQLTQRIWLLEQQLELNQSTPQFGHSLHFGGLYIGATTSVSVRKSVWFDLAWHDSTNHA
jgi:hypothetical protein